MCLGIPETQRPALTGFPKKSQKPLLLLGLGVKNSGVKNSGVKNSREQFLTYLKKSVH